MMRSLDNSQHDDMVIARKSSQALTYALKRHPSQQLLQITDESGQQCPIPLPESVLLLVHEALAAIAQGRTVTITTSDSEFSTQEAAELLLVSRPFLVQLLERGEIPFRKVGTHRRIRQQDLLAYKKHIDDQRHQTLHELAQQAQELKMGYE